MRQILKNYKTSIPGFLILALLTAYLLDYITQEQLETAVMILTAFGFLGARDFKRYHRARKSIYESRDYHNRGGKFGP